MNLFDRIAEYPPILVRLLAKEPGAGGSALSDEEVAIASGIPLDRVREISILEDWGDVTLGEFRRFLKACHFNPLKSVDRNRINAYQRRGPKFVYLQRSPHWQDTFMPLIKQYHAYSVRKEPLQATASSAYKG